MAESLTVHRCYVFLARKRTRKRVKMSDTGEVLSPGEVSSFNDRGVYVANVQQTQRKLAARWDMRGCDYLHIHCLRSLRSAEEGGNDKLLK
jgi:hypothetical protein